MSRKKPPTSTPLFPQPRPSLRPDNLVFNSYSPIGMNNSIKTPLASPETSLNKTKSPPRRGHNPPVDSSEPLPTESEEDLTEEDPQYYDDDGHDSLQNSVNSNSKPFIPDWEENQKSETSNQSSMFYFFAIIVVIFLLLLAWGSAPENDISLKDIQNAFPSQNDELWLAIQSGLNDIKTFKRPSSLMLLYDQQSEQTQESLLNEIAKYATCTLKKCDPPVILTDEQLNSPVYLDDYGVLIDRYERELARKGVMIVKNLENVAGGPAQAFHSFCDEFTPLVPEALLIFTVKIEKLEDNTLEQIENYFREQWPELTVDIFNALFTRISSMPLKIQPEKR